MTLVDLLFHFSHHITAGHGNLFNESYTAFLERNGKEIFASVGMDFEGRNYAMGGTPSGWEIGTCIEEIFGLDIDMLSWDYGMVDGRGYDRMEKIPMTPAGFAALEAELKQLKSEERPVEERAKHIGCIVGSGKRTLGGVNQVESIEVADKGENRDDPDRRQDQR